MVFFIAGGTHTGKTTLAQRMLEKYACPYLSMDHLKMGLIRSGQTELSPLSGDEELTAYLWPIVREMVKTAIENGQSLTVEGCYIPFDWQKDFSEEYLKHIKYQCIIFSENYIREHYDDILRYACVTEKRLCDGVTLNELLQDNIKNLNLAKAHGVNYVLIENQYNIEI